MISSLSSLQPFFFRLFRRLSGAENLDPSLSFSLSLLGNKFCVGRKQFPPSLCATVVPNCWYKRIQYHVLFLRGFFFIFCFSQYFWLPSFSKFRTHIIVRNISFYYIILMHPKCISRHKKRNDWQRDASS